MAEKSRLVEDDQSSAGGLEEKVPEPPEGSTVSEPPYGHGFCLCIQCYEQFLLRQKPHPEEEECEEMKSLRAERKSYEVLEQNYVEMKQLCEEQAAQCEQQVREEFSRIHRLLQEQEEKTLRDLREEKVAKTKEISLELQQVREKLKKLSNSMQELEEHLQKQSQSPHLQPNGAPASDPTPTLQPNGAPASDPTPSLQPKPAPVFDPPCLQPKAGLLMDRAKVLGNLGFRVWRNMRPSVSFSPVVLDPNTAHGSVLVSEDLRGLRSTDTKQKVPDNPERFSLYSSVLGSEGFSSGTHQWDVEVGDHSGWIIGVSRESVERKDSRSVSPRDGVWCLFHGLDNYFNGCGRKVPVQTRPRRLRIKLDYDGGKVSFYDADHMNHIYTHSDRFTERLFPFFTLNNLRPDSTEIRILTSEPDRGPVGKTSVRTKILSVFKGMFRK